MTWEDRLREAAYTPPSGIRFRFAYEDVSRSVNKRTSAFEFPSVEGAYVQDHGIGARKYPLRCYFSGSDHDLRATEFELALCERGPGRLEHPLYGAFDAIPFGDITRNDALRTAANQSVVEVTFWTTLASLYPSGQVDPRNELVAALDAFELAAAAHFEQTVDLGTAAARMATRVETQSLLKLVSGSLTDAANAVETVSRAFRDAQQALNYGLDVLIGQPLQLAQQVVNLLRAPAIAATGIESRLEAYGRLLERIYAAARTVDYAGGQFIASTAQRVSNSFHTSDMFAASAIAAALRASTAHTFRTRAEALATADTLSNAFDAWVAWRDAARLSLGQVDPGTSYEALQHAAARAIAYLVGVSHTVATERRIVLDRARTIIDLAAELYGAVDDRLDDLISMNSLSGAEILELPAGMAIVYYG